VDAYLLKQQQQLADWARAEHRHIDVELQCEDEAGSAIHAKKPIGIAMATYPATLAGQLGQ
jgi:hypothetical protein